MQDCMIISANYKLKGCRKPVWPLAERRQNIKLVVCTFTSSAVT